MVGENNKYLCAYHGLNDEEALAKCEDNIKRATIGVRQLKQQKAASFRIEALENYLLKLKDDHIHLHPDTREWRGNL